MQFFRKQIWKVMIIASLVVAFLLCGIGCADPAPSPGGPSEPSTPTQPEDPSGPGGPEEPDDPEPQAPEKVRAVQTINDGWEFKKDDGHWSDVALPHTWNAEDGQDGGTPYDRTVAWYRRALSLSKEEGKRYYLRFEGVNTIADVYVNGNEAGSHAGGYTAFNLDVTDLLRDGDNLLEVRADNGSDIQIAPISGDFTVFGGVYRDVSLITVSDVHVDLEDNGSFGLYLTQSEVSEESAKLTVRARIVNDSAEERAVDVTATLSHASAFEDIGGMSNLLFDVQDMSGGGTVGERSVSVTIPAGEAYTFEQTFTIESPRLWNGLSDPYRYHVELEAVSGQQADVVEDDIGLRWYSVTQEGFFLNGKKYNLRGVGMHQDFADKGNALTDADFETNLRLINEIGANAVRFAHYPYNEYMYELCDRYGIVVWTEIPFVDYFPEDDADVAYFKQNLREQLVELIRQNYNVSAVCFWGLQNEVREYYNEGERDMTAFMAELYALAKQEDPTRLVTQAVNHETAQRDWASDVVCWNAYPGWYGTGSLGDVLDSRRTVSDRPMGISEYGAGANPSQHELYPEYMSSPNSSQWHPEEYQNILHEGYIADINERDWVWGTFIWNMFDFASDTFRNEGDMPGMNNKGLVSYDRTLKKDTFYLYKANWNGTERFAYITSRRYAERDERTTYIKVYSNCDAVELFLNGESLGQMQSLGNGIFFLETVSLSAGENVVRAVGTMNGSETQYTDETTFFASMSSDATVTSAQPSRLSVDADAAELILLDPSVTVEELSLLLVSKNAEYAVTLGGEPVLSGPIEAGATLTVTAEDGTAQKTYAFAAPAVSYGKTATASSTETGAGGDNVADYVLDYDPSTRWAASSASMPQYVTIDLGGVYMIDGADLYFYDAGGRYYAFSVYAGTETNALALVADRSANTTSGRVEVTFGAVAARYVRISVSGSSQGFASICEARVFGWALAPEEGCAVSYETGYFYVPEALGQIDADALRGWLGLYGNATGVQIADGAVTVFGANGSQVELQITRDPSDLEVQEPAAENVALGKPATATSEENAQNGAQCVTDGDTENTRWAGVGRSSITVDLGAEYSLREIRLYFYRPGERAYYFTVEAAGEDGEYRQIADYSENADLSGVYSVQPGDASVRYIRVTVTGNSTGGGNPSIYEIEAYR